MIAQTFAAACKQGSYLVLICDRHGRHVGIHARIQRVDRCQFHNAHGVGKQLFHVVPPGLIGQRQVQPVDNLHRLHLQAIAAGASCKKSSAVMIHKTLLAHGVSACPAAGLTCMLPCTQHDEG